MRATIAETTKCCANKLETSMPQRRAARCCGHSIDHTNVVIARTFGLAYILEASARRS
jgi:hypothetical protein